MNNYTVDRKSRNLIYTCICDWFYFFRNLVGNDGKKSSYNSRKLFVFLIESKVNDEFNI